MVSMRLLAVAMAVLAASCVSASAPDCKKIFGGSSVTVLMVAGERNDRLGAIKPLSVSGAAYFAS